MSLTRDCPAAGSSPTSHFRFTGTSSSINESSSTVFQITLPRCTAATVHHLPETVTKNSDANITNYDRSELEELKVQRRSSRSPVALITKYLSNSELENPRRQSNSSSLPSVHMAASVSGSAKNLKFGINAILSPNFSTSSSSESSDGKQIHIFISVLLCSCI